MLDGKLLRMVSGTIASLICPLLSFFFFTNDISFALRVASLAIVAHDSTVYMSSSSVEELNVLLQNEITRSTY